MRKQERQNLAERVAEKLYVLPFLLVSVYFVWTGMRELLPGLFGIIWTVLAAGVACVAWVGLLSRTETRRRLSREVRETSETAQTPETGETLDGEAVTGGALADDDILMANVDLILGRDGLTAAELEAQPEEREQLEELRVLYELRSISTEELERRVREIRDRQHQDQDR